MDIPVTHAAPRTARERQALQVVLISPYALGRQPFGLAEAAAWLERAGCETRCIDLSVARLDAEILRGADLVAIHLAMHTATRIALEVIGRIRALAPEARLAAYGLYAPMNEALLRAHGVEALLGGEYEALLVEVARRVRDGAPTLQPGPTVSTARIEFITPRRTGLPPAERYAQLQLPDGSTRTVAFAEASRGCKHRCRHCPVVPVYDGRFRVVPVAVVLADVAQQVRAGARHVSFGDPDFLNGPTHALRVLRAIRHEFPDLSFDATVKIEHIIGRAELLPELARHGCLFLTSAVESVDDRILALLDKGHTAADFDHAVALTRAAGIALAPTFVPFTPWTSMSGYLALLRRLVALRLVGAVAPVQLAIRLLVPAGSRLLGLPGFADLLGDFDPEGLGYPWRHPEPAVDRLQEAVQELAMAAERDGEARASTFARIWALAHRAAGSPEPALDLGADTTPGPRLSEAWYCCAEPTRTQLEAL